MLLFTIVRSEERVELSGGDLGRTRRGWYTFGIGLGSWYGKFSGLAIAGRLMYSGGTFVGVGVEIDISGSCTVLLVQPMRKCGKLPQWFQVPFGIPHYIRENSCWNRRVFCCIHAM
jgi:hypothetical protein